MNNNKLQYSQSHTTKIDPRISQMVKWIMKNLYLIQIPATTGDKNIWPHTDCLEKNKKAATHPQNLPKATYL
jgi:hypothetical protein